MSLIAPSAVNPLTLPSVALEKRSELPVTAGIYFVLSDTDEILYISRSKNLAQRWLAHHRHKQLEQMGNVRLAWLEVSDAALLPAVEKVLIQYFKPQLNQQLVRIRKLPINKGGSTGRPGGNPDFGTKYKANKYGDKALSEMIVTRVDLDTKTQLKEIVEQKNCTIPELVRAAIEQYLSDSRSGSAGHFNR